MEKQVKVCDKCAERVADGICDVCDKDLCQGCRVAFMIRITSNSDLPLATYMLCSNCYSVLVDGMREECRKQESRDHVSSFSKIYKAPIREWLKKRAIAEALKRGQENYSDNSDSEEEED